MEETLQTTHFLVKLFLLNIHSHNHLKGSKIVTLNWLISDPLFVSFDLSTGDISSVEAIPVGHSDITGIATSDKFAYAVTDDWPAIYKVDINIIDFYSILISARQEHIGSNWIAHSSILWCCSIFLQWTSLCSMSRWYLQNK